MRCISLKISGRVQGVWFRASTKAEAERLSLTGFVRNESDGSVYIEVMGEEKVVQEFIAWCHRGPKFARVENVEIGIIAPKEMQGFRIER